MRKHFLMLFSVGLLFSQGAWANSQCNLKPGDKIHCSTCKTLNDFAFYGASALYSAGWQRSIQVTGNNGSDISVSSYTAWNEADLSVRLGKLGEFGFFLPYPSFREAQVTAYDINHKLTGSLPNGGRYPYSALKAKCKNIEKQKKEESAQARSNRGSGGGGGGGAGYGNPVGRHAGWINRWNSYRSSGIVTTYSCGSTCASTAGWGRSSSGGSKRTRMLLRKPT